MWKSEYAERRKQKYQSDPKEREKRKQQGRSPEENAQYMREYYERKKQEYREYRKKTQPQRNENRRKRYSVDAEYREQCKLAARNRSKESKRNGRLKSDFGLSASEYDAMLTEQGGKCIICGVAEADRKGRRFYVDHNHVTGKVRGLLCSSCNFGIGHFRDNPEFLRAAAKYLDERD